LSGNTTGKVFKVTTFGSSHGMALGAVIDGCPAGIELSEDDIQGELDKRRPGTSPVTTSRGETDQAQILSGVFQGKTDGTPIAVVVKTLNLTHRHMKHLKTPPARDTGISPGKTNI